MYSGNHAYVHPLDTLLAAALDLKDDSQFLFVFIGGGVRKKDVSNFKNKHNLSNIIQLPYQPRNTIHLSLGSADLQVVIMGNGQVGFTHPNKIYGSLFIGKPIIYIGPSPSHITDILNNLTGNIHVAHGESQRLVVELKKFACNSEANNQDIGKLNRSFTEVHYNPDKLKEEMVTIIENNTNQLASKQYSFHNLTDNHI